jgi:glycerol-3-phosphate acyltransferase PlsX
MKIALDAMGGDHAPQVTVEGAIETLKEHPDIEIILVGDTSRIEKELQGKKRFPKDRLHLRHASEVISMDESPSYALRRKKDSSIKRAIELHKAGEAQAVVSAGHSGVAMALALFILGKVPGVDRPAIAASLPTLKKPFVLIDAGANVDCKPSNILEFAYMGTAYFRAVFGIENPRVALLSIGEEDTKGNELTKEAFKLLKASGLNFKGNIEGKDLFIGDADVIVCDGFIGNVVLKLSEGLAEVIMKMLKREISDISTGRIAYLLMKPALRRFKKKTDYAEYGGAPLLGINGTCIISHGRSSAKAIKNALLVAYNLAKTGLHRTISEELSKLKETISPDLIIPASTITYAATNSISG